MIRITGGAFRGRRLDVPDGIRPTTDQVRKAAFDLLGPDEPATRVLDAAAGSGGYGFEALSRGAGSVTFVDASGASIRTIERNAGRLDVLARCQVRRGTVAGYVRAARFETPFDLIFHDPPYDASSGDDLLSLLSLLAPGARLFHERGSGDDPLTEGPSFVDRRRYGKSWLFLYRRLD